MTRKEREREAYLQREAQRRADRAGERITIQKRRRIADRETQHGRYIDAGYEAWDDRGE